MANIAIIIDSLSGGGAEKVVLTLAKGFIEEEANVTVFSLRKILAFNPPEGLNIVFPFEDQPKAEKRLFSHRSKAKLLKSAIDKTEALYGLFDLVLVNLYESYRLCSDLNLPNMHFVIHNSYVQELKREFKMGPVKYFHLKSIIKRFNNQKLIAVSAGVAEELNQSLLFNAKSVKHIYNPFDINEIESLANEPLPPNMPNKYIIHVGRAAKAKRHDILFKAFAKVDKQYKLICLSSNPKKLSTLAKKVGIDDRVVLPGFTKNPYSWMKNASALVLSSDFEGLPTVLIEALLCDTPIVSTDCCFGPREILRGNLRNYLVPTRDPNALAQAINSVIDHKLTNEDKGILSEIHLTKICQQYLALASST